MRYIVKQKDLAPVTVEAENYMMSPPSYVFFNFPPSDGAMKRKIASFRLDLVEYIIPLEGNEERLLD